MRAAVFCALALLVAGTLHVASSGAATPDDHKRPKPSSFAPHPGAQSHVYGAPIQSRILKSRPKKKPQLTSSPLPDSASAKTSSGG
jgi:hypothetical protein